MNKTKNSLFSLVKFFIGWPLSLTALYFVGIKTVTQLSQHPIKLSDLSYPSLIASAMCFLVYFFLRGYIWQKELSLFGYTIQTYESIYHWAASELKRYIPGNIWSFVGRGVRFGERGVAKKDIVTSLILEVQLILVGSFLIAIPSLISLAIPYVRAIPLSVFLLLAMLFSFSVLSAFFYQNIIYKYSKNKFVSMIVSPFSAQKHSSLLLMSAASYFFFGLGFYFSILSFVHIPQQFILLTISGLVLSYLVGYLSIITPSGLGVRELVASLVLSSVATANVANLAVLFSRIFLTITELIFVGIMYAVYRKEQR